MKKALLIAVAMIASAQNKNADLHKLFADYYEWQLRQSPELATSVGRSDYNDRWSDLSQAALDRQLADIREFRRKLAAFKPESLSEEDRLSLRILQRELAVQEEGAPLENWYMAVSHFRGPHLGVSSTIAQSPAATIKDYENLLARLRALPKFADQLGELAKTAAAKNYVQPKRVAELVISQLDTQAKTPALQSPLLRPFTKFPDTVPAADQERLRKAAVEAYEKGYVPAWTRLKETISRDYLPKARTTYGMYEAYNGRELYGFAVRQHTTTSYTPEQIHEIGLKEVKRIQDEMAAIRRDLKFQGSAEEFVSKVLEAPEMMFKSEQEILTHGREIAKRIDPELPRLFKLLPRMPYGVKAIPPDRARTAAPYYEGPAVDGSRAGNFFLRTYQPEKQSKCCMEALIIHEAVPGHHLQIALAREMQGLPDFRKVSFFAAFIEGWALYAETLGPDLGMYQSPYERYGKLQSEMMRAVRLVVDTGLHTKGFTREKGIELMRLAKGGFITEEFIASEIDRYITWPGQALAYKVGGLKIQELRAKAEKQLGPKFNVRDFHYVILRNGALPLDVLEEQVNEYIQRTLR